MLTEREIDMWMALDNWGERVDNWGGTDQDKLVQGTR
jgi:hypothetical protein